MNQEKSFGDKEVVAYFSRCSLLVSMIQSEIFVAKAKYPCTSKNGKSEQLLSPSILGVDMFQKYCTTKRKGIIPPRVSETIHRLLDKS